MLGSKPDGSRAATDAAYWDSPEVQSYLPGAAEEVVAFLRKHMTREAVIGPVKRTDLWTFPAVAVREAIMNAIVHADYAQPGAPIRVALFDDSLEVENPGLLPFGLTIEDIQKGISKLRNRVIGRVFQELKLIEQWGSGDPTNDRGLPRSRIGPSTVWKKSAPIFA